MERLQLARAALREHLGAAQLAGAAEIVIIYSGASIRLLGDAYVGSSAGQNGYMYR